MGQAATRQLRQNGPSSTGTGPEGPVPETSERLTTAQGEGVAIDDLAGFPRLEANSGAFCFGNLHLDSLRAGGTAAQNQIHICLQCREATVAGHLRASTNFDGIQICLTSRIVGIHQPDTATNNKCAGAVGCAVPITGHITLGALPEVLPTAACGPVRRCLPA